MSVLDFLSEDVVEIVAQWAADTVLEVTEALSPGGKPFGFIDKPIEEQINEYILLRDNPDAWLNYISQIAQQITDKLTNSGVSPDAILSVHPFDIATKFAISYSANLEDELRA